jgi:hypothetical protein
MSAIAKLLRSIPRGRHVPIRGSRTQNPLIHTDSLSTSLHPRADVRPRTWDVILITAQQIIEHMYTVAPGLSAMEVGMLSASYLPGRFRALNIPSRLPIVSHSST